MTRLNPIETTAVTPEIRGILDKLHVNPVETPNFLKVLARSLATMRGYAGAENALANGQLTESQREQIALTVAEINGCGYCLASHTQRAKDAGLDDEDIRLARRATATDPRSSAMLGFAQTVVLQRGEIKDHDLRIARQAGFSESEIIEIIGNIAISIFTNYLNLIARTEPDFPATRLTLETEQIFR